MHHTRFVQIPEIRIFIIPDVIQVCAFRFGHLNINPAEQVNRLAQLKEIDGGIIRNIHRKILIDGFNGKLCAAERIGVRNFLIFMPFNRHIAVAQNRGQFHNIVFAVDTDNHNRIASAREGVFVTRIHAEQRDIDNIGLPVFVGNFRGNTEVFFIHARTEIVVNPVHR